MKPDVTEAAGYLQVSSRIILGAEAVCHSMREMFEEETTEGLFVVDDNFKASSSSQPKQWKRFAIKINLSINQATIKYA